MKKVLYLTLILLLPIFMMAQGLIVGSGTTFTVNSGTDVTVSGNVSNSGTISNSGTVYLTGDWGNSGTAAAGTGLVTLDGSGLQHINGTTATTFGSLTLSNSAGALLSASVGATVNGTLTFSNGLISTGSNIFELGSSGSVSGAGSGKYVNGNFKKDIAASTSSETFEIGDASNYTPVSIAISGTTNGTGNIVASTTASQHTQIATSGINSAHDVDRFWTLANNGVTGITSYNPTVNFVSGDVTSGATTSGFVVRVYNGSSWSAITTGTQSSTSTSGSGAPSFGSGTSNDLADGDANTITVASNPSSTTVCSGAGASFTSSSTSIPAPSVQWQRQPLSGGGYVNITGSTDGGVYTGYNTMSGSTSTLTISSATGLNGYTYQAVFSNINGTATSTPATLNVNLVSAPVVSATNVTCHGLANGSITVTTPSSGGSSPYTYKLNGGGAQSSLTFSGLGALTNATVVATDNIGCVSSASNSVNVVDPSTISAPVISETDVTCHGLSNGTITVTSASTGGTGTIKYSLNGGTAQTSTSFTGLGALSGATVVASDANSCTSSASNSVNVVNPSIISAPVISETDVTCHGLSNGTITVTTASTGGTGTIKYSLNGGTAQTSTSFTGLGALSGATIVASDANSCTSSASNSVNVVDPSTISAPVISETDVTCHGLSNGTITVTSASTGGTGTIKYSLNGGTAQTSTSFTGLGALSGATVVASDANSCTSSASNSVNVVNPSIISAPVISETDVTCHGLSNGTITVTTASTGGTGTIKYSLNGGTAQTSTSFTGLGALSGATIVASDANSCTSSASNSVNVVNPSIISAPVISETDVTCHGLSNGTITVTTASTGGTGSIVYKLNGGTAQSGTSFSSLGALTGATVIAYDGNSCASSASNAVNVVDPTIVSTPVISKTDVTCHGLNNGSITVTTASTGGTGSIVYKLNGGTAQSGTSFSSLGALTGATVIAYDANSCASSASNAVNVVDPTIVSTPVISKTDVTCHGLSNGSITVTTASTGGTGSIVYKLNGGTAQSGTSFSSLGALTGATVIAYDGNSCASSASNAVNVVNPTIISTPGITAYSVSCNGSADGHIDVTTTSSGGTGTIYYSLNGGTPTTNVSFTGLSGSTGNRVVATDANGCASSASNSVDVIEPDALTFSTTSTNVTCNGFNDGTITFDVSGGTSPFTYYADYGSPSPTGPLPYSTSPITDLGPNTVVLGGNPYETYVRDNNGCTTAYTSYVYITQPDAISTPQLTATNVTCNGLGNGHIDVSPPSTGGTGSIYYSLNGGTAQTSTSFTGLGALSGATVIATDDNSCVSSTSSPVNVIDPTTISTPQITPTNVTCNGLSNGQIDVTTTSSGGTGTIYYSLNGGTPQTSTNFSGLGGLSGATVVATDDNSCASSASDPVNVIDPTTITIPQITVISNINCNGFTTGEIDVTTVSSGGTGTIYYSLNGGTPQTSTTFAGLGALSGATVVATDANGCASSASNSVDVTQPDALTFSTTSTNITCYGLTDGTITFDVSGGVSPYSYYADYGPPLPPTGPLPYSSNPITGLSTNDHLGGNPYETYVRDNNGCTTAYTSYIYITQPTPISTPQITPTNVTCNGLGNGEIDVTTTSSGGTGTIYYSLNGGTAQTSTSFTGLGALSGATVIATDDNSCVSSASSPVDVIDPTIISTPQITPTNVTCNGLGNGQIDVTTTSTGGTGTIYYSLNGGTPQTSTNFSGLGGLSGATVVATDGNSCASSASDPVNVIDPSAVSIDVISGGGPYSLNQTINFTTSVSGGTVASAYGYSWTSNSSDGFSSSAADPSISPSDLGDNGTYYLTVTDDNGCSATGSTVVVVNDSYGYSWTGGGGDGNFNNPDNWSGGQVPGGGGPTTCSDDIIISAGGTTPVISSDMQVGSVTMNAGATLELDANLSACNSWTQNGGSSTITGSGIVVLNGTAQQTIYGNASFNELMINNTAGPGGVILDPAATVTINTALDLEHGDLNTGSGSLTFTSSSSSQCAIIDNFSSDTYDGTLTGTIHAQRYYDATSYYVNQHFMGSPVNQPSLVTQFHATVGQFGGGYIEPQDDCDEQQSSPSSPYGTVFSYHEAHGATCGIAQWFAESQGNANNGEGYSVAESGQGILTLTGAANLNDNYPLNNLTNSGWSNRTHQGHILSSGWQLVSNPYLATMNLSNSNGDFDAQVQIWNANGGFAGTYQSAFAGETSDPAAIIPPFQAFMVHKSAVGGLSTFTFSGADRVRDPALFFRQSSNELTLLAKNNANGLLDQTTVAFNSDATDKFDPQYDANKLPGSLNRHTIYSVNNDEWMSKNVLNSVETTDIVPVGFEAGADGNYTLTFNGVSTFDPTTYIYLEDKKLGIMYNVREGAYNFSANASDNWDRFVLHFKQRNDSGLASLTSDQPIDIWSSENKVYVDFSNQKMENASVAIYDILGRQISDEKFTTNTIYTKEIDNLEAAYMVVKVRNNGELTTKKVFIANVK